MFIAIITLGRCYKNYDDDDVSWPRDVSMLNIINTAIMAVQDCTHHMHLTPMYIHLFSIQLVSSVTWILHQ